MTIIHMLREKTSVNMTWFNRHTEFLLSKEWSEFTRLMSGNQLEKARELCNQYNMRFIHLEIVKSISNILQSCQSNKDVLGLLSKDYNNSYNMYITMRELAIYLLAIGNETLIEKVLSKMSSMLDIIELKAPPNWNDFIVNISILRIVYLLSQGKYTQAHSAFEKHYHDGGKMCSGLHLLNDVITLNATSPLNATIIRNPKNTVTFLESRQAIIEKFDSSFFDTFYLLLIANGLNKEKLAAKEYLYFVERDAV